MTNARVTRSIELEWRNIFSILGTHLGATVAVWYMVSIHFSWATVILALILYLACHLAISIGLHRLYSHGSYVASRALEYICLALATAVFQGHADWWAAIHKAHHKWEDTDKDPHNHTRGFFYSHMGWLLTKQKRPYIIGDLRALRSHPPMKWQRRNYLKLGIGIGFVVPTLIGGLLWEDWIGAFLVAGFLRLTIQYHTTWAINSFAHTAWLGKQEYWIRTSSVNNVVLAIFSMGEGNHNSHHRFPGDYRLGLRWYDFDPGKWLLWLLGKLAFATNLRITPEDKIVSARAQAPA